MHSLTINDKDIEPYMPRGMSDGKKEDIYHLTNQISDAVSSQLPIGLSYDGNSRLILPHSLFLQDTTPSSMSEVRRPWHIHTRMKFYTQGARRAIGIDAFQMFSRDEDSRNGWKTLHLDRVDDVRLMKRDEIYKAFSIDDEIDDHTHLIDWFATIHDFVRNWNHWFRTFLLQSPSRFDLKWPNE